MKKCMIFIFVALSLQVFSQGKQTIEKPGIDRRIELLSIVFRLAGNNEYNAMQFKLYADKIDRFFSPYKDHELIRFAKQLREEKGISYDAPMSLAVFLDDDLTPLREITDNSLDRWSKEEATNFVRLLKKFYTDAECDVFFNNNQELYQEISERFTEVYQNVDLNWFSNFYGNEPTESFEIVIAPGNGGNSYGPSYIDSDGNKKVYAIMGIWATDGLGMPVFTEANYTSILIHEFNHSFVNPLLERNERIFENDGEKIFDAMKYEMSVQAYQNWETVLNEALVRASVIKYVKEHNTKQSNIDTIFNMELNNGFLWIRELVAELENYDSNRAIYPTLESYMPKLAEAYNVYAEKVLQYDAQRPRVASVEEFENGNVNVDASTKTITIHFDRPLSGQGYSIFMGNKGKEAFPLKAYEINFKTTK